MSEKYPWRKYAITEFATGNGLPASGQQIKTLAGASFAREQRTVKQPLQDQPQTATEPAATNEHHGTVTLIHAIETRNQIQIHLGREATTRLNLATQFRNLFGQLFRQKSAS